MSVNQPLNTRGQEHSSQTAGSGRFGIAMLRGGLTAQFRRSRTLDVHTSTRASQAPVFVGARELVMSREREALELPALRLAVEEQPSEDLPMLASGLLAAFGGVLA
jgi:hypothetical protein